MSSIFGKGLDPAWLYLKYPRHKRYSPYKKQLALECSQTQSLARVAAAVELTFKQLTLK